MIRNYGTVLRIASKAKQPPIVTSRAGESLPQLLPASENGKSDVLLVLPETLSGEMLDRFRTCPESKVGVDFLMKYCM